MQSLLGVDLFGAHGADMKQMEDRDATPSYKKRRLTLVRPQTEESVGWRESTRARRKLFV